MNKVIISNVFAVPSSLISNEIYVKLLPLIIHEDPGWVIKRAKGYFADPKERYIYSYSMTPDNQYYLFNRGLMGKVTDVLNESGVTYEIEDRRVMGEQLKILPHWGSSLFKFQERAIGDVVQGEDGLLVAECGSGKTVMGAALIASLQLPTLVVVTSLDILKQWIDSIHKFTDYKKHKIGIIGGGKCKIMPITITTFQSLTKFTKEEWTEVNEKFGCLILDECHHSPCASMMAITNKSKAKYRFGFTATPTRKDKKEFIMFDCLGHRTIVIPSEDLEAEGRRVIPSIEFVPMQTSLVMPTMMRWDGTKRIPDNNWSKFFTDISECKPRNERIVDVVESKCAAGHVNLVLSNRVEHCNTIYHMLSLRGMKCGLILGTMNAADRAVTTKKAKAGDLDVVVATNNLAAEGLDIPVLSCVHVLMPTSNTPFLKQAIGRACRATEGKNALAVDYVDMDCDILYNMHLTRAKFYRGENYVVLNDLKKH